MTLAPIADRRARATGVALLAAAALAAACGACTRKSEMVAAPDKVIAVKRAAGPITVDGVLDEASWRGAARTGAFGTADGKGSPILRTEAMLLWDDQNLYLGFEVEDPDVWAQYATDDNPIYNEEVVEFFANPNDDQREYYEFQVSPSNVHFDAFFPSHRSDLRKAMAWTAAWRSAVKVHGTLNKRDDLDKGYTVEIAIPFAAFHVVGGRPPRAGAHWRADMFRFERPARGQTREAHGWSPTPNWDFHSMKDWGWITFEGPGP
jgi:hypothetical protein